MVQYSRLWITALLISACMVLTVLAAGCSDADQRSAARDTIENIRVANQHIDNAEGLIANPVVTDENGERVKMPIIKVLQIKPGDKFRVAEDIVNPDALSELEKAEKLIKDAVSSNEAAPADVKAMAKAAMGRICMTRGLFYALKAEIECRRAADAMRDAGPFVARLVSENSFVASYEKLATMSDEDIAKIEKEANDAVRKLGAQLEKIKSDIAALTKNHDDLLASSRKLMAEGKELRISSGEASGTKALELYDQAREKETQADEAVAQAREAELQIASLKDQQEILDTQHVWENNKLAAAKEIAKIRSGQKNDYKTTLDTRKGVVKDIKAQLENLIKTASKAYSEAGESETLSLKAYDDASQQFKAADGLNRVSAVINQDAGVQMAAGYLCANSFYAGTEAAKFLSDVKAAWGEGSPTATAEIEKYSQNAESRKNQAEKYFNAAKDLYARDATITEPKLRWVVQGQLAGAHMELYKLLGSTTSRDEAKRILDEAAKGKESSEYLSDVLKLRELLLTE